MCGVNHAVTTWRSRIQVAGPNVAELAWASQAANHAFGQRLPAINNSLQETFYIWTRSKSKTKTTQGSVNQG